MEPRFRFKDENGNSFPDWENLKLEDLFTKINQKNVNGVIDKIIANSAELGLVDQHVVFDKDIAQKGKTDNYTIIQKGDFVYNPRKSKEAPYGPFNCYGLNEKGVVSPLYICLRPKYPYMTHYLLWYFKSSSWYSYVADNGAQGGARHDRVGMSDSLMKGIPVKLPSVPEQQKIADFLSTYDEKIVIQREKVDALERRKKSLIQKVFSQELRFRDEEGDRYPEWENYSLGSIATLINGRAYKSEEMLTKGKYLILRVGNLFTNSELLYSDLELEDDKYISEGDLIYAWSATFGPRIYSGPKCIYHYHIWKVLPKESIKKVFLRWLLEYDVWSLHKELNGGTIHHITKQDMEKRMYSIPSLPEQQKIADFLSAIDDQISIEKDRLATMERIKKGLLQGLFC